MAVLDPGEEATCPNCGVVWSDDGGAEWDVDDWKEGDDAVEVLEPLPGYDYTVSGFARYLAMDEERRGNIKSAQLWRITSWRTWDGSSLLIDPRSLKEYDGSCWPEYDSISGRAIDAHVETLRSHGELEG